MKTPRKNLKARSAVVSRKSSPTSPGWTSAKDVFRSPKSPSPVRRITRRMSVYQSKSSGTSNFKIPQPKVISPPGVKTRARRSSIYQKGAGRLISPPRNSGTRRTSIYVPSKSKTEVINVFSKVWATPVRQPDVVNEKSPENSLAKTAVTKETPSPKSAKPPKSAATTRSTGKVTESDTLRSVSPRTQIKTPKALEKSEAARSVSTKKTFKTPAAVNKSKLSKSKAESPSMSSCAKKSMKTPKSVNKSRETAGSENDPETLMEKKQQKSPKSGKKLSPVQAITQLKTPGQKAAKNSPKPRTSKKSFPGNKVKITTGPVLVTSTPTKTLEQITGKSFYATPGETPIQSQRTDDVFIFSAKPEKYAKRSLKKSVSITPAETPEPKSKQPKRMPAIKTPAAKRTRQNDSPDLDVSSNVSPSVKKVRATPNMRTIRAVKRSGKKSSPTDTLSSKEKKKLSPVEMSSVLMSVVQTEKIHAEFPSPRPSKRAKILSTELHTPKVIKTVKRSSPKKLAEIVSVCQNTNNNSNIDENTMDVTLLNDTINTDSRSSRCIIL